MHEPPPPFIGTWEQMRGSGKKSNPDIKKGTRLATCQFTVQKRTSIKPHTTKPKFH